MHWSQRVPECMCASVLEYMYVRICVSVYVCVACTHKYVWFVWGGMCAVCMDVCIHACVYV